MPCFQLSCFRTNTTDDDVIVVEECKGEEKGEEVRKKGKQYLRFWMKKSEKTVPFRVGQTGEIEIEMVDGGNPLQAEVEAVKKPLRQTVEGDVGESMFGRLFHIFSPKANKKRTSKLSKNRSYPQPPQVQLISEFHLSTKTTTNPRPVSIISPKPDSDRSPTANLLLPCTTPKGKQPIFCPVFSPTVCRKTERAAESSGELSMRSTERKTEDVVVKKLEDLRIIRFVGCVILILMTLVGGHAFAIICTSLFFYFAPFMRASSSPTAGLVVGDPKPKEEYLGIDYYSKEYKKKVVLEGLLERTGRRPAGFLH